MSIDFFVVTFILFFNFRIRCPFKIWFKDIDRESDSEHISVKISCLGLLDVYRMVEILRNKMTYQMLILSRSKSKSTATLAQGSQHFIFDTQDLAYLVSRFLDSDDKEHFALKTDCNSDFQI